MTYSRIESMARSAEIDDGVAAPTADALWMLGRQWQFGELTGDDAVQPAGVRVKVRHAPLVSYRPEGGADGDAAGHVVPIPTGAPLEAVVERSPVPTDGASAAFLSADMGERLRRRLRRAGLGGAFEALGDEFRLAVDAGSIQLPSAEAAIVAMLRRRAVDGRAIAGARDDRLRSAMGSLSSSEQDEALAVVAAWRRAERWDDPDRVDEVDQGSVDGVVGGSWRPHRFEHRFSVAADTGAGQVVLEAEEYAGGRLDWHSFDVGDGPAHPPVPRPDGAPRPTTTTTTMIATPVEFAGMPASRWWEFEDGEVNLGDLDGGPGDLARLAVAEFATVYNDDWFVVPVRLRRGELARVESVEVVDTFGETHVIDPASLVDRHVIERSAFGARSDATSGERDTDARPWRFLELDGDRHVDEGRAPWMLVPPSVGSTLHGPDLERVVFARDEDANLAWAIERLIEGPLGRAVDRARATARSSEPRTDDVADDSTPRRYGDESWRWQLESSPPPWWIPFVPDRDDPDSEQVVLRRARMATWDTRDRAEVGPKGTLLEPTRPFFVREEEVPRSGATVSRMWQWARWEDGSTHLWMQRRKQNGRGERSSGLEWDALVPQFDPETGTRRRQQRPNG